VTKAKLNSNALTSGLERAAHRSLLHGLGLRREDFGKPIIGVVNSWTDIVPGHMHLGELSQAVREGICSAGGVPREFHTCAVCDGLAQGHVGMNYSLPSRENIADTVEIMTRAHCLDGLVLICGCDKVVPGQLMAALRLDIPAILVTSGCMAAGEWGPYKHITLSSMREFVGKIKAEQLTPAELDAVEEAAIPGAGTCAMLGTANTMSCLGEALGVALPGMGASPARSAYKLRLARSSGERSVALVKEGLTARRIVTREALLNAVAVDMALGGSTNSVLHLLAMAREASVELSLKDFDRASVTVPHLCDLLPGGAYPLPDFYRDGGVPALIAELAPLLHIGVSTVEGYTLAERIKVWQEQQQAAPVSRPVKVIRSLEQPLNKWGGLAVLYGSLAPAGAVVKVAAVDASQMVMRGPALPFEKMEAAVEAALAGRIKPGDIVVVRNEGPRGGPGMREMHMLSSILAGMEARAAVITDGRFSGSSRGLCVGHVCPEAAAAGPIALVQPGDSILVDIPGRRLELEVAPEDLARRTPHNLETVQPPRGVLSKYQALAEEASRGALLK
jgi:dihydroxy-acid dehydratase